ncbi:unnamed protein product [Rhizophagus irregularis]|nr:unnamed protein product [Rhizophagus irregularis]
MHLRSRIQHLSFNSSLIKPVPTVPLFRFPYDQISKLHNPTAISMTPLANESNIQQALLSESPKLWETYNDYVSQARDTNTSIQYYSRQQELIHYYMDFNKYYHKTFFEYRFSTDNGIFYDKDLEEFIEDFNLFTNTFSDKFKN